MQVENIISYSQWDDEKNIIYRYIQRKEIYKKSLNDIFS